MIEEWTTTIKLHFVGVRLNTGNNSENGGYAQGSKESIFLNFGFCEIILPEQIFFNMSHRLRFYHLKPLK